MTSTDLLGEDKVMIPINEYIELIKAKKENETLKKENEKLIRMNFGLKTTVQNLQRTLYRRERWNG